MVKKLALIALLVLLSATAASAQVPKLETLIEAEMFRLQHLDVLRDFDACFSAWA